MNVATMTYAELFAAAVAEARRREIPVWDETPPVNRTRLVNGLSLHYLDWGGADKPPLMLIHGARVHAHTWDFFSLDMRQYFHIYAVDLPGHGDSEWAADADYNRSRLAADVSELIDQLGLESLILIGHSLGGSVATLVASHLPQRIRALGLVDTTLLMPARPYPLGGLLEGPDTFPTLEAFAQHAARFNKRRDPERLVLSLRWNTRQLPNGDWTWKYDRALRQSGASARPVGLRADDFDKLWAALGEIAAPVLFVRAAEHSHLSDEAAERLRALSNVRLVVVPNSAHNVMGDNPHVFKREVSEFLSAGGLL
jgi:pimeloyl-ACP methyl ester carboxylesterase